MGSRERRELGGKDVHVGEAAAAEMEANLAAGGKHVDACRFPEEEISSACDANYMPLKAVLLAAEGVRAS